jgi:AcrR family transcriptional regulator
MATASPSRNAPGLRERKNARTRAAITRAALELALESGFEHATVAKIAERADVAPRTVHQWFPSKEDIVLSAIDLPIDRLATELATGDGDTLDRIRRWLDGERQAHTEPDEITRLRHQLLLSDPQLRAGQRARQQAIEDLIATAIADETELPPDAVAPRALAAAIVTTLLAMQERFAEQREQYDQDFAGTRDMLRAALDALRARAAIQ